MYKRNRASGNFREKIACGKIIRELRGTDLNLLFFSKCIIR